MKWFLDHYKDIHKNRAPWWIKLVEQSVSFVVRDLMDPQEAEELEGLKVPLFAWGSRAVSLQSCQDYSNSDLLRTELTPGRSAIWHSAHILVFGERFSFETFSDVATTNLGALACLCLDKTRWCQALTDSDAIHLVCWWVLSLVVDVFWSDWRSVGIELSEKEKKWSFVLWQMKNFSSVFLFDSICDKESLSFNIVFGQPCGKPMTWSFFTTLARRRNLGCGSKNEIHFSHVHQKGKAFLQTLRAKHFRKKNTRVVGFKKKNHR